jgi:hypothetical protein
MKNKKYLLKKRAQTVDPEGGYEEPKEVQTFTDIEDILESTGRPVKIDEFLRSKEDDPLTSLIKEESSETEYTEEEIQEELDMYKREMLDAVKSGHIPEDLLKYESFKFEQAFRERKGLSEEHASDDVIKAYRDYLEGDSLGIRSFGLENDAIAFHKTFVDRLPEILESGKKKVSGKE